MVCGKLKFISDCANLALAFELGAFDSFSLHFAIVLFLATCSFFVCLLLCKETFKGP